MKKFFYLIILFLIVDLTFHSCANIGRPTGGPKDSIPPTLVYSIPETGTTNFDGQELTLEFSEYINADKLKQQLIITPKTDIQFKSVIKRNRLVIKLDTKLEDSTTYNFNFADGVTDITENNPATNLSIAFSTGPYIDSLSITGFVEELLTKEPGKKYVVGLYPFTDSLDYFTTNPIYFTTTNDSGRYSINYIKTGIYKIISFKDENSNYLLDPETESHGFLEDTINLMTSMKLDPIRCILQNVKPIELINHRPVGSYVELKFNKSPDSYTIEPQYLNHQKTGDKKDIIRIYKPDQINYEDSLTVSVTVSDSLGNMIDEDRKIVFLESSRKKGKLSISTTPNQIDLTKTQKINLVFNKPITQFDSTNISIKADSTFFYPISLISKWNDNRTSAELFTQIDTDSLYQQFEKSLFTDSSQIDSTSQELKQSDLRQKTPTKKLSIEIPEGSFISVEGDTSNAVLIPVIKESEKPKGTLKIDIETSKKSFNLQLLDDNGKVRYNQKNQKAISFNTISPGNYTIRILIDDNNDGNWSYGNLLKNQEAESVYLHPEEISIRENWIVEMGISF